MTDDFTTMLENGMEISVIHSCHALEGLLKSSYGIDNYNTWTTSDQDIFLEKPANDESCKNMFIRSKISGFAVLNGNSVTVRFDDIDNPEFYIDIHINHTTRAITNIDGRHESAYALFYRPKPPFNIVLPLIEKYAPFTPMKGSFKAELVGSRLYVWDTNVTCSAFEIDCDIAPFF